MTPPQAVHRKHRASTTPRAISDGILHSHTNRPSAPRIGVGVLCPEFDGRGIRLSITSVFYFRLCEETSHTAPSSRSPHHLLPDTLIGNPPTGLKITPIARVCPPSGHKAPQNRIRTCGMIKMSSSESSSNLKRYLKRCMCIWTLANFSQDAD